MPRTSIGAGGLLIAVLAAAVFAPQIRAGTTGKLSGRVVNEKKEPLAGVNLRIEGVPLGAISDEKGNYFIIGIPAGTYVVRANLLGQAPFVAENVAITPDFTTTLDVTMRTQAVEMREVRVEAERPLLQKDATGTTRFISSADIQKLPTRGYRDAAANQTGVVNFQRQIDRETQNSNTLVVRGGRPNETAYIVDGFSQQDPLTGTSSTSISNNSIEEVVLLTGGFAPEYGRIMSGAVNVITREGAKKYSGALESVTDALAGKWIKAPVTDYNIYDGSLGGPVWPGYDKLTFYTSGERRWQRDRSPSFMPGVLQDQLQSLGLDPDFKPNNSTSGYTFQGKLAWQLSDRMSLKAGGLGSEERWREYLQPYLMNLAHSPRYLDRNQSYTATFNHVISSRTFWTAGGSFFETLRKRGDGVAFDNLSQYYIDPNPRFDLSVPMFWLDGHVFDDYLQRKSAYWGFQGSLTSQVNAHNQLKAGADFQRHTLRFFEHYFPVQLGGTDPNLDDFDAYGYELKVDRDPVTGEVTRVRLVEGGSGRDGPKHPQTWSGFLQDKFEREGVIVNGGLRFDHINVDTPALKNPLLPLGDPDDPNNLPDSLEVQDLATNKTYSRLSPRVGVAFPLDERTLLRFNYGQFYQQPNLQDLYVSYRFLQHKVQTGGYFVGFGDPNLRPERTIAYEFGLARQIGDRSRLDVTAYYKDVKDLVSIVTIPSFPNNYASYRNTDFATVKGIDLGFTMRPINHLSGNLAYSLSFAEGTGSVSLSHSNIAWTASNQPKQTSPLDFDQRHKLSANLDWRYGKGEGPALGKGFHPFEDTGINFLFNVGSGTPYTPTKIFNEVTLAAVATEPVGPINSRYGPWTSSLDLKANRAFTVRQTRFDAFVWVLNAFDTRNATNVYLSSGSPFSTNFLTTPDGQQYLQTASDFGIDNAEQLYHLAESNPNLFSNPRLVRFGLRTSF